MKSENERADEITTAASGMMDDACNLRELADKINDNGDMLCVSADLWESSRHLYHGAHDPECPECGKIIPPEGEWYYPDDCPHCGAEPDPFTWAESLDMTVDTLADLVNEYKDSPEVIEGLKPIIKRCKKRMNVIGNITEAIRITRKHIPVR